MRWLGCHGSIVAFAVFLGACSSGGGGGGSFGGPADSGSDTGAHSGGVSGSVSNGGNAGLGGGSGGSGGTSATLAGDLGRECNFYTPCPEGFSCMQITSSTKPDGFCTRSCATDDECAAAHSGAGVARCTGNGANGKFCLIHCGDLANGSTACPPGMGCTHDASGDGTPDTCTEEGTTTTTPNGKTTLRSVTGMDGASVQVCLDGKAFGPELDLVFDKTWTSTYLTADLGAHKVDAWPYAGQPCMSPSSMTTSFDLSSGESYTLFVAKTGFTGVRALKDDFSPPLAGKARVRIVRSSTSISSGSIDVCSGSEVWGTAIGTSGAPQYVNVDPPTGSITLRTTASTACTGAVVGSFSLALAADSVYSLFLIDDQSDKSAALLVSCHDGAQGQQIFNGICAYTTVD